MNAGFRELNIFTVGISDRTVSAESVAEVGIGDSHVCSQNGQHEPAGKSNSCANETESSFRRLLFSGFSIGLTTTSRAGIFLL